MLEIYISPEVRDQDKDDSGNILFSVQNASTWKPLSFSKGGGNFPITSFIAVKVDSKGNEISRTVLSNSIIIIDSTNNIYKADGSIIYANLLDECIYYFEFQNGRDLYYSEYFLVQEENIFFTVDNNSGTCDTDLYTCDKTKLII